MVLRGPFPIPKVTILTPSCRPSFLVQCARYVARQTYPKDRLEWLIVNSSDADVSFRGVNDLLLLGMRVGVLQLKGAVGALRNAGLRVATGDLVVHFDDDDWHAPDRIERQVVPFLTNPALDLVATDDYHIGLFNESPVRAMRSWSWGFETYSSGGSFMYRRRAWLQKSFANIGQGEDHVFANGIRASGSTHVRNLHDPGLFIAVRHGKNTCEFDEDVRLQGTVKEADWLRSLMGHEDFEATRFLSMSDNQRKG